MLSGIPNIWNFPQKNFQTNSPPVTVRIETILILRLRAQFMWPNWKEGKKKNVLMIYSIYSNFLKKNSWKLYLSNPYQTICDDLHKSWDRKRHPFIGFCRCLTLLRFERSGGPQGTNTILKLAQGALFLTIVISQ